MRKQQSLFYLTIALISVMVNCQSYSYTPFRDYTVSWKIDGVLMTIQFNLTTSTTGWVGLGLNTQGVMTGSDMYLCYNMSGNVNCTDRYAMGHTLPGLDIAQGGKSSIFNVCQMYKNKTSTYSFTRYLNTTDKNDLQITQGAQIYLLFAEGSMTKNNYNVHSKEMSVAVTLWPKTNTSSIDTSYLTYPGVKTMNLTFNYKVPAISTAYTCKYFNITQMAKNQTGKSLWTQYHAIAFNTIPGLPAIDHHMVLYTCPSDPVWTNEYFECSTMPGECQEFTYVWAMGQSIQVLPSNVGTIWGQNTVVVQMHYNNQNLSKTLVDKTIVQIYYSSTLRKYDAGIMLVGVQDDAQNIKIPAKSSHYAVSDICTSSCTKQSPGTINIIYSGLHGHQRLKQIFTYITYPNGTKDTTSMVNNNFNFENQYQLSYSNPIVLSPGYSLNTTCIYNNSGNSQTVYGGENSTMEMCFNFIQFYPKANGLAYCSTSMNNCVLQEQF